MTKLPAQPIMGLMDGLTVLQELAASVAPVSGIKLAKTLHIEQTKVNRILKTLAWMGFAYRTSQGHYSSGPAMHVLAAQSLYGSGLIQRSIKQLTELTKIGHIVAMGMLWRNQVAYLFFWQPGTPLQESFGKTSLFPATHSSIGMALLAEKDDEAVRQIIRDDNIPGFNNIDELLGELKIIRKNNYAKVFYNTRYSYAVTIGHPAYAAIAISGHAIDSQEEYIIQRLNETAGQIEIQNNG